MRDLDVSTRLRGVGGRAAEARRGAIETEYQEGLTSLRSGATFGLLEDVYKEQGARGSLDEYFTQQWGVPDFGSAGAATARQGRQQRPVAPPQPGVQEEEESVGVGKIYSFY